MSKTQINTQIMAVYRKVCKLSKSGLIMINPDFFFVKLIKPLSFTYEKR